MAVVCRLLPQQGMSPTCPYDSSTRLIDSLLNFRRRDTLAACPSVLLLVYLAQKESVLIRAENKAWMKAVLKFFSSTAPGRTYRKD